MCFALRNILESKIMDKHHQESPLDSAFALFFPPNELSLTAGGFRTIFHLPQANDNNHNLFVPPPSFYDMVLCSINNNGLFNGTVVIVGSTAVADNQMMYALSNTFTWIMRSFYGKEFTILFIIQHLQFLQSRQKTSEYEAYVSGESSSGQVNEEERDPSTSDPEAPALSLINQDLLYMKKGSSGPAKIVLSLHKFPAIIFNDDDIEERTSRWIVARRANECIVSITEPDYKNLNKNDIKDMYLLIMNGKVPDYAETGLLWSLSVIIRSSVILERVHDFHIGIKSYQQKVNLTAPIILKSPTKYKSFPKCPWFCISVSQSTLGETPKQDLTYRRIKKRGDLQVMWSQSVVFKPAASDRVRNITFHKVLGNSELRVVVLVINVTFWIHGVPQLQGHEKDVSGIMLPVHSDYLYTGVKMRLLEFAISDLDTLISYGNLVTGSGDITCARGFSVNCKGDRWWNKGLKAIANGKLVVAVIRWATWKLMSQPELKRELKMEL
ncbi:hypothetical protein Tco_1346455 [Tanacetum coccineum]